MKHALVLLLIAPTLFGAASIRPQQLRSEYRVNPQGIDALKFAMAERVLLPVPPL